MLYATFEFLHVLGVVLLVGNVTITAFWKVLADRSQDPAIVSHAQHLVTLTDWIFTLLGISLILVGGYGMVWLGDIDVTEPTWLVLGQLLFFLSGAIWLFILVPLQVRQARAAKAFEKLGRIPDAYWRDSRRWLAWGIIATIPLIAAMAVMIAKP